VPSRRREERLPPAIRRPARGISARGPGPSGVGAGPRPRRLSERRKGRVNVDLSGWCGLCLCRGHSGYPSTWLSWSIAAPGNPGEGGFFPLPDIIHGIAEQTTACVQRLDLCFSRRTVPLRAWCRRGRWRSPVGSRRRTRVLGRLFARPRGAWRARLDRAGWPGRGRFSSTGGSRR